MHYPDALALTLTLSLTLSLSIPSDSGSDLATDSGQHGDADKNGNALWSVLIVVAVLCIYLIVAAGYLAQKRKAENTEMETSKVVAVEQRDLDEDDIDKDADHPKQQNAETARFTPQIFKRKIAKTVEVKR